ncbi:uncharacterized protein FIESC28_05880 [Fusarium coffeatum]|uniref:Carrier domain-containing protein n=1 Tax=Fusarium coffeatum TaxID=231269 RepID=A0A366RNP4_9HYPO|nr:uncharacterized protein FIESC28_05880 [Fusarium coffeatum]RBR18739.1 hypothetical protein FIESC28_05880 [Fusarium coffeatum]
METRKPDKPRVVAFSNEFPSDSPESLLRSLYRNSKLRNHHHLARFLDEATTAVRHEVVDLPPEMRKLVPSFDSVHTLATDKVLRRGVLGSSIDGVLLCVLQIGSSINYREATLSGFDITQSEDTVLVGLGIGLLAAAALATAPDIGSLPALGAEAVRIAFRLGVFVSEVSQNIEPLNEDSQFESWAYVVHGVAAEEVQQELDAMYSQLPIPEIGRIFISAKSENSVTVSGPPSRLKEIFRTSAFFCCHKSVALPVFGGLCHAAHVYSAKDATHIVGPPQRRVSYSPQIPVLSTSTGLPFTAQATSQLFQQVVTEILTQTITWSNVVQQVTERFRDCSNPDADIFIFGPSRDTRDITTGWTSAVPNININLVDVIDSLKGLESPEGKSRAPSRSKIAIVGMSCRLPGGATDTQKFWDILHQGLDVHRLIPKDRFDVNTHYDPEGKAVNASHTPYGCFIEDPGLFDAPFFNISPREAEQTDPMQRLMLITAYEALERAGFVLGRTPSAEKDRVGTWYGQASDDYREVNTAQNISTYFIPGGCRAFGPGRINYFFKFSGPSFSCDTACSSSLAAIQAACTALWGGEVDTVVAGGSNVVTNSDAFSGLSHGHFLTKTPNACKTWDADADGYCRADGVVSFVLKRLEDAEADNDNILGLILGAGTNHSADAVSITHPHAPTQSLLYRKVLDQAGVDPLDVSYIEAHGTGTQAGDIQEVTSIKDVFSPLERRRSQKYPLYMGAVKSNVGHGEAVAGATALLKVLLMFEHQSIPPHVGIRTELNPKLSRIMHQSNLHITFQDTPWTRTVDRKRVALVNSFSAAGGNTSLVLEEGPVQANRNLDPRAMGSHAIALSAKCKKSLKGNMTRMLDYLERNPSISLADLAYTTTARRQHYNYRTVTHAADREDLRRQLAGSIESVDVHVPIQTSSIPSVAFTFTGQGAANKSPNFELYHLSPVFRSQLDTLDSITQQLGFPSFIPSIDGSHDKNYDHGTVVSQIALTCIQIAQAKYWETLSIKPDVVLGHSLGEYAALCVAGVLSASDAIYLVGSRAKLLDERCEKGSHGMLAVRASVDRTKEVIKALGVEYDIACINGPEATVLSATCEEMESIETALRDKRLHCTPLRILYAFHSNQTEPILDDFESFAKASTIFREPKIPIISPLLAKVICDDKTINSTYVRRATRETCNFEAALRTALSMSMVDKDTLWIELGPHSVNTNFIKAIAGPSCVAVPTFRRDENNWETISHSLGTLHCAGLEIDWSEFHRPFQTCLRLVDLPTYCWNNKNYWIQYNGNWALTKGNTFYDKKGSVAPVSSFSTSLVQTIVDEEFSGASAMVTMESDLMSSDFLEAARGHSMNGHAVVTSSIHADIAYTLGEYVTKQLGSPLKSESLSIKNLQVVKGLVVHNNTAKSQFIRVVARTSDIESGVSLGWYNIASIGSLESEPFATATVVCHEAPATLQSWTSISHLIESRINTLEDMANRGLATRFSRNMAYTLFAHSLVTYSEKYRGMQSVVMHELEGFAHVKLCTETKGVWTIPPHFIDSVAHLAGFIMNVSDSHDMTTQFCVTSGWESMCFAEPLNAGAELVSYVKMIPCKNEKDVFLGDVYVMSEGAIVGKVGGIRFKRYPRILLDRFFSPPDPKSNEPPVNNVFQDVPSTHKANQVPLTPPERSTNSTQSSLTRSHKSPNTISLSNSASIQPETPSSGESSSPLAKAIAIISDQMGIPISELQDDCNFADIGVDSLMSLVLAEQFRVELGITVNSSHFLEYPNLGALKTWLWEYCA